MLVMISSISVPIYNCFHTRKANSGKKPFLGGYTYMTPSRTGFIESRESKLGLLKSTFYAENYICMLSRLISCHFSTIQS